MKKLTQLLNDSKSPFPQDDYCISICILSILSQNMNKNIQASDLIKVIILLPHQGNS